MFPSKSSTHGGRDLGSSVFRQLAGMALAQTGCWMESVSWVKGAHPAHQKPSSGLEIQAGDSGDEDSRCPGGAVLGMYRVVPAWEQLLGSLCPYQCRGYK